LSRDVFDIEFAVLSGLEKFDKTVLPVQPFLFEEKPRRGMRHLFRIICRLASFIRRTQPDIVHAMCRTSEFCALLATKMSGQGVVLGVRRNVGYWHTWRSLWFSRITARLGAKYAANCEAARKFADCAEWISPRRVTVIPNPVFSERIKEGLANVPHRSELGILESDQVVGMVATVRPVKDYATFLRAAGLVLQERPHTRFLVIGSEYGAYPLQMRKLAEELNIASQISWLGSMANPLGIVSMMDVAVLSSQSEAMSNAIVEYMAAGVAVVATDVGGTSELVDENVTGYLVPHGSPEIMANRICELLGNASLRRSFGENACRKAVNLWAEERVLEKYSVLYQELAAK
jgi:L-malate glycosyltransferase